MCGGKLDANRYGIGNRRRPVSGGEYCFLTVIKINDEIIMGLTPIYTANQPAIYLLVKSERGMIDWCTLSGYDYFDSHLVYFIQLGVLFYFVLF